ncbi:MAG: PDZ domain-containing protein, partial [Acidimicrobiales bacterium]|nr:PDZ domain-containing protein [Acidimicrobiales bacterium]
AGFAGLAMLIGGIVVLGLLAGWSIVVVIVALMVMIFFHELGHYLTAKWAGMKVTEFFLFFGPRLFSFRRGETEYGMKLIPAGAYVKIIGMTNFEEVDPADESRTYRQAPYWRRLSVAVAGSTMHFIMALILMVVFLVGYGSIRDADTWAVREITPNSAAERAGLIEGDRLLAINGQDTTDWADLSDILTPFDGEQVTLTVERDGTTFDTETVIGERLTVEGAAAIDGLFPNDIVLSVDGIAVTTYDEIIGAVGGRFGQELTAVVSWIDGPESHPIIVEREVEDGARGFLGVSRADVRNDVSLLAAPGEAVTEFGRTTKGAVVGLVNFFRPSSIGDFLGGLFDEAELDEDVAAELTPLDEQRALSSAGTVDDENRILSIYGIVDLITDSVEADGLSALIIGMALINIFIGVFNLLPVLPFDGGHVVIATYEKIRSIISGQRYFADATKALPLVYAVLALFLVLTVVALTLDITQPV